MSNNLAIIDRWRECAVIIGARKATITLWTEFGVDDEKLARLVSKWHSVATREFYAIPTPLSQITHNWPHQLTLCDP